MDVRYPQHKSLFVLLVANRIWSHTPCHVMAAPPLQEEPREERSDLRRCCMLADGAFKSAVEVGKWGAEEG